MTSPALSPALFVAAANPLLSVRQWDRRRREPTVEAMLHGVGLPADARWGAAFIHYVGRSAHYQHHGDLSDWPLPATGSCDALARFAAERRVLHDFPKPGDVALTCFSPTGEYIQAAYVLEVLEDGRLGGDGAIYYNCRTLEGNTDLSGALDGPGVFRLTRTYIPAAGDRFIRWVDLDGRGLASTGRGQVQAAA